MVISSNVYKSSWDDTLLITLLLVTSCALAKLTNISTRNAFMLWVVKTGVTCVTSSVNVAILVLYTILWLLQLARTAINAFWGATYYRWCSFRPLLSLHVTVRDGSWNTVKHFRACQKRAIARWCYLFPAEPAPSSHEISGQKWADLTINKYQINGKELNVFLFLSRKKNKCKNLWLM